MLLPLLDSNKSSYIIDVDDADEKKKSKKRKMDFCPDYVALANHVRSIVEAPSLRSKPRDDFECICEICFRGSFKGKVLPLSQFQTMEKSKPGGLNSSHHDSDPGEGTSASTSSSGIHFSYALLSAVPFIFFLTKIFRDHGHRSFFKKK